jgi:hypothetical protein
MTDLGDLHHFLGISVTRSADGLFLSQRQHAVDLLQRAGMAECHSTATHVDTQAKLSATDDTLVADATQYRSLASALQYLALTRPDLAYVVQPVCLFMQDPRGLTLRCSSVSCSMSRVLCPPGFTSAHATSPA